MAYHKKRISKFFYTTIIILSFALPCFASSGNPYLDIGILLFEQGYYSEAVNELQTALEHDPENPETLKYLRMAQQSLSLANQESVPQTLPEQANNEIILSETTQPMSSPSAIRNQTIDKAMAELENQNQITETYIIEQKGNEKISYGPFTSVAEATEQQPSNPSAISNTPSSLTPSTAHEVPERKDYDENFIRSTKPPEETPGLSPADLLDPNQLPPKQSSSTFVSPLTKEDVSQEKPPTGSIHGILHLGFGYESGDAYWRNANFNLNEKNYRAISWNRLDRRLNTFDPAIYSRYEVNMDVEPVDNPLSFHTDVAIDPWSYVGKSKLRTLQNTGGTQDHIDVQLLYAGNTVYTENMDVDTLNAGDLVSIPELKLVHGQIAATTLQSKFGNTFLLPDTKVTSYFQPVRELWFDYEPTETMHFTVFPLALETKAFTTDDPMRLSNNRTWWEESPWLASWKPGHYNAKDGIAPPWDVPDFTKGRWDDALAFAVRDSEGRRLTGLRGASFNFDKEQTEMSLTVASPKTLWQDYDVLNASEASFRAKQYICDNLYIGTLDNFHAGYFKEDMDSFNIVTAYDMGFKPSTNSTITAEYAFSHIEQDMTNKNYDTRHNGSAYDLQMILSSSGIQCADQDYFRIQASEGEQNFFKTRLRMTRMDNGFKSNLSTYLETRDDEYWGRHITFREPVSFRDINYGDIDPYRIGNGIDYDRYTISWRTDSSLLDKKIKGLTDIRNVHETSTNKYIETVARTEIGWQPDNRLETKGLLLAHHLPLTTGGFDPFITRIQDGETMANAAIPDAEDANLYTTSLGMKYWFYDWLAWDGTWERTNDFTVATDNYPRGILNDKSLSTYTSYGNIYREEYAYLYNQGSFPLPPYEFYNIFRTGLTFKPDSNWDIYLDYTRNPYEWAGPLDDNLNHISLSTIYSPTKNLQLYAKYTWSRMNDINEVVYNPGGDIEFESHHNIFAEAQYLFKDESRFTVSFGVGPSVYSGYATSNPYGGSISPVLDTQHMIRMSYTKNF